MKAAIVTSICISSFIAMSGVTWLYYWNPYFLFNPFGESLLPERVIYILQDRDKYLSVKEFTEKRIEHEDAYVDVIYPLRYELQATEVYSEIAPLVEFSHGGNIVIDAASNTLLITALPFRMNELVQIIERIEKRETMKYNQSGEDNA